MAVHGIDLGTTNSCIARLDNAGNPQVVHDENNASDTLASAIYVTEEGEYLVGAAAKEEAVTHPESTFQFWKRYIGRTDIPDMPTYTANGRTYSPVELSQIVLEKIADYARAAGEDVSDVVITCPAYFDFGQREATRQAGQLAGLNVLAVLNEPTAAALYYCVNRFNEQSTRVLVYDLGGGTFDVSLIEVYMDGETRKVKVLATDGDFMLGGVDWDNCLFELLLQKYAEQYGVTPDSIDEELRREFRGQTENTKQKLSRRDKATVKLAYEGDKIQVEVTREEFEAATRHLLDQTVAMLDSALGSAGCTDSDIDIVLMVGGSTKMPQVQEMLNNRFGEKVQFNEPDLAVAKGAALVANILYEDTYMGEGGKGEGGSSSGDGKTCPGYNPEGEVSTKGTTIEIENDVAPRSFGVGVLSDWEGQDSVYVCDNIVKMNEPTPVGYTRTYYTPRENMKLIRVRLFESKSLDDKLLPCLNANGEEQYVDPALDMKYRNSLEMPIPEGFNLPAGTEVIVDFGVDKTGTVSITVTVPAANNTTKKAEFSFYEKLTQEQIDKAAEERESRVFIDGE